MKKTRTYRSKRVVEVDDLDLPDLDPERERTRMVAGIVVGAALIVLDLVLLAWAIVT